MRKKMIMMLAIVVQILVMLLYSFVDLQIPEYTYLAVWLVCALIVRHSVNSMKVI